MTDKEKAQAYDKALNWMRTIYPSLSGADKEDAEHFFPQLRESEEERIRKALIDALKVSETIGELKFRLPYPTREECIAYLEKQKEQKPEKINLNALLTSDRLASAEMTGRLKERSEILENPEKYGLQKYAEWSDEDKRMIDNIIYCLPGMAIGTIEMLPSLAKQYALRLKSLFPSWKPSEQEKDALRTAIHILTEERNFPKTGAQLQNILNAFEGKESRKDWKPSKEHMKALFHAVNKARTLYFTSIDGCPEYNDPRSLYEQLKNLM